MARNGICSGNHLSFYDGLHWGFFHQGQLHISKYFVSSLIQNQLSQNSLLSLRPRLKLDLREHPVHPASDWCHAIHSVKAATQRL